MDTIFALSSGTPPAGIAVVRVTGPAAGSALSELAGSVPLPRTAVLRKLRDAQGELLDRAIVVWFPGPNTVSGEDLAELHLHGGRAVINAVERRLAALPGLRPAHPGEFTRRAFANGRIDLAQAEGLADLLEAETELQRKMAIATAGGALSRRVEDWRERVLLLSALVEAVLDFGDEDDVGELPTAFQEDRARLAAEIGDMLQAPAIEALQGGIRVAIGGPPNAGKSTLFNALIDRDAAIASPIAGTTRDVLEVRVALNGVLVTFVDMAGVRERGADAVEEMGIARARTQLADADLVLWLGPENDGPAGAWEIEAQIDLLGAPAKRSPRHRLSAVTGKGLEELQEDLAEFVRSASPKPGQFALNHRQRETLRQAWERLDDSAERDFLLIAEELRAARSSFDRITGRSSTDDVLDSLFGRFCIGK